MRTHNIMRETRAHAHMRYHIYTHAHSIIIFHRSCMLCWSMKSCVVLLSLLWSLVEVNSQTEYPYVSFMGQNLSNNSYVNLTLVGEDDGDPGNTVRCITDLATCCSPTQGIHGGDWYFPNETRLDVNESSVDMYAIEGAQEVALNHRNSVASPSGIYRCDVATNDVHNDTDLTVVEIIYVGIYYASEGNNIL